jgi:hypothetical protein
MNPRWTAIAFLITVALFFTGHVLFLFLLGLWVLVGLLA